jgi:acetyl-CoA carboxylase biotin carboxyl carrier protein
MFKFEELCTLIRLVGSTEVALVEIEHAGARLRIEGKAPVPLMGLVPEETRAAAGPVVASAPARAAATSTAVETGDSGVHPTEVGEEDGLQYVVSPIVGTFYRAPNPDAEPYVKVGDSVNRGHTLCIVEAMKLMNEIECDVSGTIVKVYPDNAQPVEYGERLFAIRAS